MSWGRAGDLAVTCTFAAMAGVGAVVALHDGGSGWRAGAVCAAELLAVAALTLRRQRPLPVLAVVTVLGAAAAAVADRTTIGPLLPAVALYTLASRRSWQTSAAAGAGVLCCYALGERAGRTHTPEQYVVLAALLLVAVTVGLYAGERRAALETASARAEQAERERLLLAERAVLSQRVWIARELHDVIGHHVSLLVVQAGAVRSTLPGDHPGYPVLTSMIEGGREAMTEMRRLVAVLGDPRDESDGGDPAGGPPPGLDDVSVLCERLRTAGLPVQLAVDVSGPLTRTAGITAYRIVQEALTNVVKHAGQVPTRVEIRGDGRLLDLRVTNSRPSAPPDDRLGSGGHGLEGIRHRTALFGGELAAGHVPGGGFALRATLRLRGEP
ncbi:sensor histidine kinase [Actinacidiphila acidipaludis]|uniref:histidine kinase n=1 Tax=Actinacidiphila acidipaludis TaxID=2873382 RepID=A0ABS7PZN9_9ACTN|nr:histidine kinase [Streptomyces acidipaludis]MBY8876354.1 hypothetical protein [Streptomyces acidipaludis]